MCDVLVKTTLLMLVAAVLTRRSRHATAADAHRLWLVVLFSPLLVIAASAALPPVAFLIPRVDVARAAAGVRAEWLVMAYGVVAVVLLGRIGAGLWAVGTLRRQARPLGRADLARLRRLAGEPRLDLREADLLVPVTAGVVRPIVILPRGWRGLSLAALTAILRHEAAHVRRKDCAVALAAAVIEAAFWFSPAVWVASSRVRWFAETACDAEAEQGMASGEYAAELLELCAGWAGARSPRYAITAGAETHVARRIRLLIDGMGSSGRRGPLLPAAIVLVLLATVLSTAVRVSASRHIESSGWGFDHEFIHPHQHGH